MSTRLRGRRRNFSIARLELRYAPLFVLPTLLLLGVFQFYPMLSGFLMSLTNWNGFDVRTWVGLENYRDAILDTNFQTALYNTLIYVAGCVPATILLSLLFAMLLNMKMRGTTFFRAVYYLPAITSGVSIAMIWKWIFNTDFGLLNTTLYQLGIKTMTPWLNSSKYAMTAIVIMSVWKSLGTNIILMLAGLQSVPYTLREAAEIDGASRLQTFRHVTLPMVSPTIFLVGILSMIGAFQVFDTIMTMTKGGPGNSTLVAVYYIYRVAFENFRMGYASAMAFILFVLILGITILQWLVKSRWVYSELD